MSLFAKAKKARENKKGFTLVELIVVLVILAILAAILVPALLGWIDKAKEKQIVLDARSAYLAAQTLASEEYGKKTPNKANISKTAINNLAGVSGSLVFTYKNNAAGVTTRSAFEVVPDSYTAGGTGGKTIYYRNGEWTSTS